MPTHINFRWEEMAEAMEATKKLRDLAKAYGYNDPFADNNIKTLQLVVALGLDPVVDRLGPDALDRLGNEYELKTLDTSKGVRGFSTNHHLRHATIERFRTRRFIFATYESSTLTAAYFVESKDMEPIYDKWKILLRGQTHLNNPKIPLDYVKEVGKIAYLKDVSPPWT